jgi:hypothetical protein
VKRFDIVVRLEDGSRELAGVPEATIAEIQKDLDRRARRVTDHAR